METFSNLKLSTVNISFLSFYRPHDAGYMTQHENQSTTEGCKMQPKYTENKNKCLYFGKQLHRLNAKLCAQKYDIRK